MFKTVLLILAGALLLAGCSLRGQVMDGPGMVNSYRQIDQATASEMMARDDGHIVVDVRSLDEYESGHIPGAICIPNESITSEQPEELPNLRQTVLIYCRSGNRSKQAAEKLFEMGYDNICEFGGINDWDGAVVTGQTLTLTVASNPTTGYSWVAEQDEALLDIQSFYVAEPQDRPVSGSGGWQTFVLTPKESGTARVTFRCCRSWEPSDADPAFTCVFELSGDGTITVTEGGEEAEAFGCTPVIRIY